MIVYPLFLRKNPIKKTKNLIKMLENFEKKCKLV